jgi:hypothetical protein
MRLHSTLLTGTFVRRLRKRLCDIATHEGFGDHVVDACGLGAFGQLRATVAAHEDDRDFRSQLPDLARKLGPGVIRHRLVCEHEIEPVGSA